MDEQEYYCGFTATVVFEGNVARKVYLPEHRCLAGAEVEALEQAWEIGLPVPQLLTVVYGDNGEVTEIVTTKVEGRTLDQLQGLELSLALEKVKRWVARALRYGLNLDLTELTSIRGNVKVDATGKVWLIDLN